jgi:hypothetical protein
MYLISLVVLAAVIHAPLSRPTTLSRNAGDGVFKEHSVDVSDTLWE